MAVGCCVIRLAYVASWLGSSMPFTPIEIQFVDYAQLFKKNKKKRMTVGHCSLVFQSVTYHSHQRLRAALHTRLMPPQYQDCALAYRGSTERLVVVIMAVTGLNSRPNRTKYYDSLYDRPLPLALPECWLRPKNEKSCTSPKTSLPQPALQQLCCQNRKEKLLLQRHLLLCRNRMESSL